MNTADCEVCAGTDTCYECDGDGLCHSEWHGDGEDEEHTNEDCCATSGKGVCTVCDGSGRCEECDGEFALKPIVGLSLNINIGDEHGNALQR